jgi:hypothetical protein
MAKPVRPKVTFKRAACDPRHEGPKGGETDVGPDGAEDIVEELSGVTIECSERPPDRLLGIKPLSPSIKSPGAYPEPAGYF